MYRKILKEKILTEKNFRFYSIYKDCNHYIFNINNDYIEEYLRVFDLKNLQIEEFESEYSLIFTIFGGKLKLDKFGFNLDKYKRVKLPFFAEDSPKELKFLCNRRSFKNLKTCSKILVNFVENRIHIFKNLISYKILIRENDIEIISKNQNADINTFIIKTKKEGKYYEF